VLSLAALGAVVLSEGVKFLYDQAGELIRQRRARSAGKGESGKGESGESSAEPTVTPEVVAEPRELPSPDLTQVDRFADELRELRRDLSEFASGVDPVDPDDEQLVARIDALRQVLEVIYGTPVTLAGEQRDPATPIIRGRVDADEVAGYVAAVRADRATGVIEGHTTVRRVEQSGTVIGVEIRRDPSGPRS
jgi:hypothetical protein